MHVQTEYKSDDTTGSLHVELQNIFDQFTKYHIKILIVDLSAKLGTGRYFEMDNWEQQFKLNQKCQ
jgi:hypothetical protein